VVMLRGTSVLFRGGALWALLLVALPPRPGAAYQQLQLGAAISGRLAPSEVRPPLDPFIIISTLTPALRRRLRTSIGVGRRGDTCWSSSRSPCKMTDFRILC
jgi:hypothetical protein